MDTVISGIILTPLKTIPGNKGSVLHGITDEAPGYAGFGEAYFSTVVKGAIKGWKKHSRMVLNLIVVTGKIRFVVFDDRPSSPSCGKSMVIELSPKENNQRLTVLPGLWVAFEGLDSQENKLLNFASIKHDPLEAENCEIDSGRIPYSFQQH